MLAAFSIAAIATFSVSALVIATLIGIYIKNLRKKTIYEKLINY